MNVLYILGNGFDKAQGMATGYPEFYKHLQEKVTEGSVLLGKMKGKITEEQKLWSDMEERLGDFTAASDNADEFDDFYFELSQHLQKYLADESAGFVPTGRLKDKFRADFVNPGRYLGELDKNRYNTFLRNNGFSTQNISVITLNYTDTLEKLLDLSGTVTSKKFGVNIELNDIIHLHGRLGESIIIGVDNENQIRNEKFRLNDDIRDLMIKTQSNQVMKETRHLQCEALIRKAHVIVLFGVSLGDTDARWWELIGSNMVSRSNLAVIQHLFEPGAVAPTQMQRIGRLERRQQRCLMQKMRIEESDWTEGLRGRLFFTVNAPVFKLEGE